MAQGPAHIPVHCPSHPASPRMSHASDGQCHMEAARDLAPGEVVGRLPTALVITAITALSSPEGQLLARYEAAMRDAVPPVAGCSAQAVPGKTHRRGPTSAWPDLGGAPAAAWLPLPSRWYLYLFMVAEAAKGARSHWAPYFATSPTHFDDPLWFTPAQRRLLEGSNLEAALQLDEAMLSTCYAACFPGLHAWAPEAAQTLFPADVFALDRVRWARSLYASRCFPGNAAPRTPATPVHAACELTRSPRLRRVARSGPDEGGHGGDRPDGGA